VKINQFHTSNKFYIFLLRTKITYTLLGPKLYMYEVHKKIPKKKKKIGIVEFGITRGNLLKKKLKTHTHKKKIFTSENMIEKNIVTFVIKFFVRIKLIYFELVQILGVYFE
jgi:hypothetical protein